MGELGDPKANALVHLEGTRQGVSIDREDDLSLVEEETARENASVGEDKEPHIELQKPGVSHLAMLEEAQSLT